MSYRGSFTKCIETMAVLFEQQRYELLHIVVCPKGKYYTLYTPEEYESYILKKAGDPDRVVCSLTRKEMHLLYVKTQQDIFTTKPE